MILNVLISLQAFRFICKPGFLSKYQDDFYLSDAGNVEHFPILIYKYDSLHLGNINAILLLYLNTVNDDKQNMKKISTPNKIKNTAA